LVDVRSNLDNPALLPLLDARSATYGGEQELRSLTRDSLEYVHELVAWMLRDRGWPLDYLAPLYDVFADTSVTHLDVFTLNHDLILDRGLTEHRISFSDGFEERQGTLLLWTDTYSVPSRRFFKLRGSLNWYRYNLDLDGWTGQVVAKPAPGTSSEHPVGPRGEDLGSPCERRAEFLAGRFTKILAYPSGIYADQHARFHESLRIADGVLVVGYGFRDRAINSRLISWMTRPRATPRMVVIDPAAADIEQRAREAIALKWRRWLSSAAVVAAANRLGEETPWPELRAALTARTSTSTPARGRIRSKPPDRSLGQGRRRRPDGLTAPRSRARPRPNAAHAAGSPARRYAPRRPPGRAQALSRAGWSTLRPAQLATFQPALTHGEVPLTHELADEASSTMAAWSERRDDGAAQSPSTSARAASRSRSSLALRRPTDSPSLSGLTAVVCSTSTRVVDPSRWIVGRNDRGGAAVEVGETSTVESASSSSAWTTTA